MEPTLHGDHWSVAEVTEVQGSRMTWCGGCEKPGNVTVVDAQGIFDLGDEPPEAGTEDDSRLRRLLGSFCEPGRGLFNALLVVFHLHGVRPSPLGVPFLLPFDDPGRSCCARKRGV